MFFSVGYLYLLGNSMGGVTVKGLTQLHGCKEVQELGAGKHFLFLNLDSCLYQAYLVARYLASEIL